MSEGSVSATGSSSFGPVSAVLVAELREEARKHGALVWLDKDGAHTPLVDALVAGADGFPFPVLA